MKHISPRILSLLATFFLVGTLHPTRASDRPNIVLIYSDDQDLSQIGAYGGQETPHIDQLAKDGIRLNRYYVGTALCAPSRYGLQTARYASAAPATLRDYPAGGPVHLLQTLGDEHNRPAEEWVLPVSLKNAGYTTGFVGKYHLGFMGKRARTSGETCLDDPEKLAKLRHNFELAQQGAYAGGYDYAEGLFQDNPQPGNFYKDVMFHNQDWVTWNALQFIDQNKDQPFFLIMNSTLPHWPGQDKVDSLGADRTITPVGRVEDYPQVQPSRESVLERAEKVDGTQFGWFGEGYKAHIIWLDDAVGSLVKRLKELGLYENTLILFVSDHGSHGKWSCDNNQAGAILHWPGRIAAGTTSDALVQNVDLAPTIFELVGVEPADGFKMHGVSAASVLLGKEDDVQRDAAFLEIAYQRAVISDDNWKYMTVRFPEEIQAQVAQGKQFDIRGREVDGKPAVMDELYDLNADPNMRTNLFANPAHAEKLDEMKALMATKCQQLPHTYGEFTE